MSVTVSFSRLPRRRLATDSGFGLQDAYIVRQTQLTDSMVETMFVHRMVVSQVQLRRRDFFAEQHVEVEQLQFFGHWLDAAGCGSARPIVHAHNHAAPV